MTWVRQASIWNFINWKRKEIIHNRYDLVKIIAGFSWSFKLMNNAIGGRDITHGLEPLAWNHWFKKIIGQVMRTGSFTKVCRKKGKSFNSWLWSWRAKRWTHEGKKNHLRQRRCDQSFKDWQCYKREEFKKITWRCWFWIRK